MKIFVGKGSGVITVGPTLRRFFYDKAKKGYSSQTDIGFSIGVAAYFH